MSFQLQLSLLISILLYIYIYTNVLFCVYQNTCLVRVRLILSQWSRVLSVPALPPQLKDCSGDKTRKPFRSRTQQARSPWKHYLPPNFDIFVSKLPRSLKEPRSKVKKRSLQGINDYCLLCHLLEACREEFQTRLVSRNVCNLSSPARSRLVLTVPPSACKVRWLEVCQYYSICNGGAVATGLSILFDLYRRSFQPQVGQYYLICSCGALAT